MSIVNKKFILFFMVFVGIILSSNSFGETIGDDDVTQKLKELVNSMSIKELIGQKIIVGSPWVLPEGSPFYGIREKGSSSLEQLKSLIESYKVTNFILSKANYRDWVSYQQQKRCIFQEINDYPRLNHEIVKNQISQIREISRSITPEVQEPFIFVDFEGGRVQGIRGTGISSTPSPMGLAATRDFHGIHEYSRKVAELLTTLGVNVNLAPVVDINYEGRLSLIGTRAFSSSPMLVTECARSFILGQLEKGISTTLKHWPGHGKVSNIPIDSNENEDFHKYKEPLSIDLSLALFQTPYIKLLEEPVIKRNSAVMTSHLLIKDFADECKHGEDQQIVTFCQDAVSRLRKDLKFESGVVITDDISYLQATSKDTLYETLLKSFNSGHDMVIISSLTPSFFRAPYRDREKDICTESYNEGSMRINLDKFKVGIQFTQPTTICCG